jgi:hypothetical protein
MTMLVKPAPGLKVRYPESRLHLAEESAEVPESSYWLRRLACGDVVKADPPRNEPESEGDE